MCDEVMPITSEAGSLVSPLLHTTLQTVVTKMIICTCWAKNIIFAFLKSSFFGRNILLESFFFMKVWPFCTKFKFSSSWNQYLEADMISHYTKNPKKIQKETIMRLTLWWWPHFISIFQIEDVLCRTRISREQWKCRLGVIHKLRNHFWGSR